LTITVCHSAADLESAGELQRYLLENFGGDVCRRVIDSSVREAVDFALSGDRVIVLLSPDAVPQVEDGWEEILLHKHAFYVLVRQCRFPPLIQRNRARFVDGRSDRLAAQRTAKRWLLGHHVASDGRMDEELCRAVADKPGFAECGLAAAARFAEQAASDFEKVILIDGRARTLPSICYEMQTEIGAHSRVLIVLRGAIPELADTVSIPPFASLLRTEYEQAPPEDPGRVRTQLASALNGRGEVEEAPFDRTLQTCLDEEFVRLATAWLLRNGRLEEALGVLDRMLKARPAVSDLARERAWIHDQLSGSVHAPLLDSAHPEQLSIPFAEHSRYDLSGAS
jgi:hypothetical protein